LFNVNLFAYFWTTQNAFYCVPVFKHGIYFLHYGLLEERENSKSNCSPSLITNQSSYVTSRSKQLDRKRGQFDFLTVLCQNL
jgi:hypothetical protein